jgi:membrane protein DedA with SNARE-associated domain
MSVLSHQELDQLIASYGYLAVAVGVGLESLGLPLPGETILVLAAIYAAAHADLNIWLVFVAACFGAIAGDNCGYWLGFRFGYPLIKKYGRYFGLREWRIKVGQYLFLRYGTRVVFWGRFVALLRMLAAFLAGVNRMRWETFMVANALGGVVWAALFALAGYLLGTLVLRLEGLLAPIVLAGAATIFFGGGLLVWRLEDRLRYQAERAFPGPLA